MLKTPLACLLAVVAGLLAPFAFAPFQLWPMMLLSLALLFVVLERSHWPFWVGFCYALGFYGYGLSWIHVSIFEFGGVPLAVSYALVALLVFYLALFPAFACYLAAKWPTPRRTLYYLVIFPGCWILTEWLRARLFTGFPWLMPGYSQINSPLAGYAATFGVYGVTLTSVMFSALIVYWLKRPSQVMRLLLPALILLLGWALGQHSYTQAQPALKVALVQGNEAIETKWVPENRIPTLKRYWQLTNAHKDADIIIWPESALPMLESQAEPYLRSFDHDLSARNQALITGIIHRDPLTDQYYNAIVVLGQKTANSEDSTAYAYGGKDRYYKRHLLPIGEFVPFEKWLRPLAKLFDLPMSSFSDGQDHQADITVKGHHWLSAICYEIAFGNEIQQMISAKTDAILTISNDTWFGRSAGPAQHLEIAQMRALEFQRPVVRGTNTGYTALIDSHGKITQSLPIYETQVLAGTIIPHTGRTGYQIWGLWPIYLFELVAAILLFRTLGKRTKSADEHF